MEKINTVKNIVKIQNIKLIGSYADDDLVNKGDVDFQDIIKTNCSVDDILPFFVSRYKKIESYPDTYITDFKAGFYSGKPIRWSYEDLKRGYKRYDNDLRIYFRDVLTQDSIIKLDIVTLINDIYTEITTNYYFIFKDYRTFKILNKKELEQKILYDYRRRKEEDIYKSLKRLYIYYKHIGDQKKVNTLQNLFNSNLGVLSKRISELETINLLIKNKKKPKKKKIVKAIYNINNKLGDDRLTKLDGKTFKEISNLISEIIEKNKKILDVEVKQIIKKSNLKNIVK